MKRDRLNNLYIAIIQVIIVSSINYSQILQNKFSHYTVDDGILSNIVNEVMQDRIGYLWLATSNGLTRYDGYEFVNFSPNMNDSTALQLPLLSTLFEDSEGDIWIGGVQGISKYNRNTGMFKNYSLKKYEDELNEFYVVTDLEETEDKEILATLYSFDRENIAAGLLKYKNDLDNFEIIDLIGNDSTNALAKIKKIGKTLFLVSGTRGIGEFNTTDKIINWLPIEKNTIVTSFLEEDDQTLWLGTINKGLVKYNRRDFTFTKYPQFDKIQNDNDDFVITDILLDHNNNLLLASNKGLLLFDKKKETFKIQKASTQIPAALHSNYIQNIIKDNSGSLWFATWGNGLSKYNIVNNFNAFTSDTYGNSFSWLERAFEPNEIEIWLSSPNSQVYVFNRESETFNTPEYLKGFNMRAALKDKNNQIWLASNDGIYVSKSNNINFQRLSIPIDFSTNTVNVFLEDAEGRIWLGTDDGLFIYDKKSQSTGRIDFNDLGLGSSLTSNIIRVIEKDKYDNIWLATDDGLFKYDNQKKQYSRIGYSSEKSASLLTQNVNALYCDDYGIIWAGTWLGGLNSFDPTTGALISYTKNEGLNSHSVQAILGDEENGALWISTFDGISRFDMQTKEFNHFDVDDGIQGNQFSDGGMLETSSGEFIFCGQNGFTIFRPEKIQSNLYPPKVIINDFKLFNESVKVGIDSPLETSIFNTKEIQLTHDQNDVSFEFTAFHFVNPRKNQYAYIMENYEDDWRYIGGQRTAIYPNLPPGQYIFRVKASNNNELWNEEGKSISIIIHQPWYKMWWAYGLYGFMLFGFLYTVRKFELNQRRKNEELKENRMRAEAAELQARAIQAENDRKTKELEEARRLQLSMLPKELPQLPNLDIAVYMQTATEVGGDYYDFHIGLDGTLTAVLGDATGHGMKAGTMVTSTKSLFNVLAPNPDIKATFHEMTRCFKLMKMEKLSMCMTMLKISGNKLQMSAAGMPPVYIYRNDKNSVEEHVFKGMPLGTMENFPYVIESNGLERGDTILMMSDGFPELMNNEKEMFGFRRTRNLFEDIAEGKPEEIIKELKDAGYNWIKDKDPDDDVTFVVIKVK